MAKFNMLSFSGRLVIIILMGNSNLLGQGNCLIYPDDSGERLACELSYRALEYRQGSKESQILFDAAIRLGPDYAWAYYEKSVPFFKRGLLAEGMSLISKAIDLEPENYLYYRAYWYFHHRSYEMCIQDLEELYVTHKASFASTPAGDMEMRLVLGMAYAQSGQVQKGIYWVEQMLDSYEGKEHLQGMYDYHCLGVMYYLNNEYDKAKEVFKQQIEVNKQFADTYYYMGLISLKQEQIQEAEDFFDIAQNKMSRKEGGYSLNIFGEFNVSPDVIETQVHKTQSLH